MELESSLLAPSDAAQRKRWPRLSCIVIDILSILAINAEPERVFSGARRTISWDRCQMSAPVIETTECLKHAIRSRITDDDDEEEEEELGHEME